MIGIIIIAAGLLIAIYPSLLSLVVASLLILVGTVLLIHAYHIQKFSRTSPHPVIQFILRY